MRNGTLDVSCRGSRIVPACVVLLGVCLAVDAIEATQVGAQAANAERLADAETLGWVVGESEAPVTVVEFTDVSCPYCASFHAGTRAELVTEFVTSGRVRWITLTYVSGLYPNSEALSLAAECAGRQGRYEGFLRMAYEDRNAWVGARASRVAAAIERLVEHTDLDAVAFESCRRDVASSERIERVRKLAHEVGVRGTPTWFVDGFLVMGDLPLGYARQFITTRLPG